MFEDLNEGFIAFLHLGIVGLHVTEISHAETITIGVIVAGAYAITSWIEFNHARKHIAHRHHEHVQEEVKENEKEAA